MAKPQPRQMKSCEIENELWDKLIAASLMKHISVSDIVNQALREYFEQKG